MKTNQHINNNTLKLTRSPTNTSNRQVLLVELVPKDIWYLCSTGCRFVLLHSTDPKSPFLEGEGELGESSAPAPSNVQVFEKVLGARRGIYRGLGRKPSLSSALGHVSPHEKEKTRPQFSEVTLFFLFSKLLL
ncbi:hypothetical protein Hanom_Chr16g01493491 [Helianthus anomalus]